MIGPFEQTMPFPRALEAANREAERHLTSGFPFPDLETWIGRQSDRAAQTD